MFFHALVSKLPVGIQPYAKACVPLAAGVAAAAADLSISGEEFRALAELAGGAVTALLVLKTPNLS
jgi:hypothetical protein